MVLLKRTGLARLRTQARVLKDGGFAGGLFVVAVAAAPIVGRGAFGYVLALAVAAIVGGAGIGVAHMVALEKPGAHLLRSVGLYGGCLAALLLFFMGPPLTGFALIAPAGIGAYLHARSHRHAPSFTLALAPLAFAFTAWWTKSDTQGQALWGVVVASLALAASEVQRLGANASVLLAQSAPASKRMAAEAPDGVATESWLEGTMVMRLFSAVVWIAVAFLVAGLLVLNRENLLAIDVLGSLDVAVAAAVLVGAGAGLAYLTVQKKRAAPVEGWGRPPVVDAKSADADRRR